MQAAKLVIYFYNLLIVCQIKYKKMLLRWFCDSTAFLSQEMKHEKTGAIA